MSNIKSPLPLRSVSQLNEFTKCPMAYKLSRIDKEWSRPAAWLPQGTAVHSVLEAVELARVQGTPMSLDEAKELFKETYSKHTGALCAETPNFDWWFWSGPYNGTRDVERRFEIGLEQIEKFFAWRDANGQEIWVTPDKVDRRCMTTENHEHHVDGCECRPGEPAIELSFKIELDGILVRGFIDAVVVVNGKPLVRDYKTGAKPGDDFQLGVYALAVNTLFGTEITEGDYFMAGKKGVKAKPTPVFDLSKWTREAVTKRFHEVEAEIQAGNFEAKPEPDKCGFCSVNFSCPVFQ